MSANCRGACKRHDVGFVLIATSPQPACRIWDELRIAPARLCAGEPSHNGFMRNPIATRRCIGFGCILPRFLLWIGRIEFEEERIKNFLARSAYIYFFLSFFFFASIARPLRLRLRVCFCPLGTLRILITLVIADGYYGLRRARLRVYLRLNFETIQKRANAFVGSPAPNFRHVAQRVGKLAAPKI